MTKFKMFREKVNMKLLKGCEIIQVLSMSIIYLELYDVKVEFSPNSKW